MPSTSGFGRVLLKTYLFWFTVSFLNFELLSGLAIPILAVYYVRFLPFLAMPLALAAVIVTVLAKRFSLRSTLLLNAAFLLFLLLFGELVKDSLIWLQLRGHTPKCVDYGSFAKSALVPGRNFFANGIYEEDGKVYLWSYSKLDFYQASPGLAVNFSCSE